MYILRCKKCDKKLIFKENLQTNLMICNANHQLSRNVHSLCLLAISLAS